MDTWSSKLIGCRRLLQKALVRPANNSNVPIGIQCVLLHYNWAVTMAKTLLRGLVPATLFNELECIDEGL